MRQIITKVIYDFYTHRMGNHSGLAGTGACPYVHSRILKYDSYISIYRLYAPLLRMKYEQNSKIKPPQPALRLRYGTRYNAASIKEDLTWITALAPR